MNIEFEDIALKELYLNGRTNSRKYAKLPPMLVKRYIKTVNYLKAARRVEDLYVVKALHYEKKHGTLKGVEAVWIDPQYRLLFQSSPDSDGIVVNALLYEISKHYE